MVIDTSVLIAVLFEESDADRYESAIASDEQPKISAASFLEASIVVGQKYPFLGTDALDLLIARWGVEVLPVTMEQAQVARAAYRQYGRGNHKAALNFGDCFSYALASILGQPLLFKGQDFSLTDLEIVLRET